MKKTAILTASLALLASTSVLATTPTSCPPNSAISFNSGWILADEHTPNWNLTVVGNPSAYQAPFFAAAFIHNPPAKMECDYASSSEDNYIKLTSKTSDYSPTGPWVYYSMGNMYLCRNFDPHSCGANKS